MEFKPFAYLWIQRLTRTTDAAGGWAETWSNWKRVKVEVRRARAREVGFAEQITLDTSYEIKMRYLPELTIEDRLRMDDGRILEIVGLVNVDERNRFQRLTCEEIGAENS